MNIRTFQADSMAEALQLVKRELGAEAVILHTRTLRRGGVLGFGAKTLVEVTASTDVSIVPPRMRRQVLGDAQRDRQPAAPANAQPPARRTISPVLRQAYAGSGAETGGVALADPPALASRVDALELAAQPPRDDRPGPGDAQITDEIRQIRRMVCRMMRNQSEQTRTDLPDRLFDEYLALLEQEVTREIADDVVSQVRQSLGEDELSDRAAVRRAVAERLASLIPTDTAATIDPTRKPADGRPLTIALIGPTGVGKTTTLAKLAATFKLRHNLKVALVTVDTYRIAAVDQLATYASIINLPLEVVLTPEDLAAALERVKDHDVVLIDTAGRSQRDDDKLDELARFIEAADPHQVHLVLSSTASQGVLLEAVDRFAKIRTDRIIFTKLDEAVSFGVLLNVVRRVNKQLSYVTTGQEVPHQIEPGDSARLAGLILGATI